MVITLSDKNHACDTVIRVWSDTGNYFNLISARGFNAIIKDFFFCGKASPILIRKI